MRGVVVVGVLTVGIIAAVVIVYTMPRWRSPASAAAGAAPLVEIPLGPQPGPQVVTLPAVSNPFTRDRVALQEGRQLFQVFNCSGCHGGHAGGGMGPSLRDVTFAYGGSDQAIFDSIAQGRANGMPAWGLRLNREQIWKLVAYIKSLRTEMEPDPPTSMQYEDLPAAQRVAVMGSAR